jgi:hypothetical protein
MNVGRMMIENARWGVPYNEWHIESSYHILKTQGVCCWWKKTWNYEP